MLADGLFLIFLFLLHGLLYSYFLPHAQAEVCGRKRKTMSCSHSYFFLFRSVLVFGIVTVDDSGVWYRASGHGQIRKI